MKRQTRDPWDRERNEYRREATDRLKNRPTFDPFFSLSLYWPRELGQERNR